MSGTPATSRKFHKFWSTSRPLERRTNFNEIQSSIGEPVEVLGRDPIKELRDHGVF